MGFQKEKKNLTITTKAEMKMEHSIVAFVTPLAVRSGVL